MLFWMISPKHFIKLIRAISVRRSLRLGCTHPRVELPFRHLERFVGRDVRLPTILNKCTSVVQPAALRDQRFDFSADMFVCVWARLPSTGLTCLAAVSGHPTSSAAFELGAGGRDGLGASRRVATGAAPFGSEHSVSCMQRVLNGPLIKNDVPMQFPDL